MTVKEFPTDEAERFRKIEDIIERFKALGLPEKIIKDLEDWLAQEKGIQDRVSQKQMQLFT